MTDDASRFAALFDGRKDAYGVDRGGVVKRALTPRMYADHVSGLVGAAIGVFPVRDDATVKFAAIDLDEPNFELAVELAGLLPGHVWIERSRSGNAHIWTFFADPLSAWAARAVLRAATFAAGRPEVEVFPKQAELREGMVGNYINLPYYGNERPMVWQTDEPDPPLIKTDQDRAPYPLFKRFENPYSLEAFLHDAEPRRNDPEEWLRRARAIGAEPPGRRRDDSEFGTRASVHVCAEYMLEHKEDNPLAPGHRHVVLFNLAKMLGNVQSWTEEDVLLAVESYNQAGVVPLASHEVEQTVRNAIAGRFTSTGCDDPIMAPYVSPDCKIAHG